MIRDEFKNADKKVIDKKANKKIQELGERQYYAKKLSFYSDLLKPVKFSTVFSLVSFCLLSALFLFALIVEGFENIRTLEIILFSVTFAVIVWTLVWFLILVPRIKKKTAFYKSEMMRLNREYIMKNIKR